MNNIDMCSLYANDNGVCSVSTPSKYYRVSMKDGKVDEVVAGNTNSYSHYLKRQYGKHQVTYEEAGVTFQRIISTVYDRNEQRCRYAVVQYIHRDGDEGDKVVRPHGTVTIKNDSSSRQARTCLSVSKRGRYRQIPEGFSKS